MKYLKTLSKHLNIISFDVPYPPNYGGAIDVFYKLKTLHELGVKINLHTYEYGRGEPIELQKYCDSIFYYKRNKKLKHVFSRTPFIVKTRANETLVKNLQSNKYPILFEGIHSTSPLLKEDFKNRTILIRAHNIEHNYYKGLSKSETNKFKKLYFNSEAIKLYKFQNIFKKATCILSISPTEQAYFLNEFPSKSVYIPAFHQNKTIACLKGKGEFALYHGDIRVADNLKACEYLIKTFAKTNYPLIIASNHSNLKLELEINNHKNIEYQKIKNNDELFELIHTAHINVLPTFQNTGIKLKLINALFNGRFCLVNNEMILNTGLEQLCHIANSKNEFLKKIEEIFIQEFTENNILERKELLKTFDSQVNAQKIIDLLP